MLQQRDPKAKKLIAIAERFDVAAERAFVRWVHGEVMTSSAAERLRRQADEAWADVRIEVEGGADIEWAAANGRQVPTTGRK